jgi:hypothetical protein
VTLRQTSALLIFAALALSTGAASAGVTLDPFRRAGAAVSLDPVRVADATPAPAAKPPVPTAAAGKACRSDDDCPDRTICEQLTCQAVPSTTNVLYLYYREGAFTEIAGLYWSKRGSSGYRIFAPFYWHTWAPKSEAHVVLPPLFWRFEDYTSRNVVTIVAPLAVSSRSPDSSFTWVFPLNFGWRDKDRAHQIVFPLFYGSQHKNGGSFWSWFGYDSKDGESEDGAVLWLYWHGEDRKERTGYNVLFPLLWDFTDKDDRSTVFFPLVWSYGSKDGNTTLAIPWFHARRGPWTFDTLFPIWWASRDDKEGTAFKMLVPLVYWQSTNHGRSSTWVTPIGGYSRDDDARSRTLTLLPLLTFWRHDPKRQIQVFTPLWIHHQSYPDESSTRLIGGLLYLRSDPQGTTRALLPLIWRFHDAQTGATATAFLPFFGRREGPRDTTTAVGVFPLWFYGRSFKSGGWSGGVFPLAFFGDNAGRRHDVIFPFAWHFAEGEKSTSLLIPIFYEHTDGKNYDRVVLPLLAAEGEHDGDSYHVLAPFVWRFASESRGTSTTAGILGYFHRDRDGWSLGVGPIVPLLYARSGATRSHAVLFPIFWHFRDAAEQSSTTVVGPFWHRSVGQESTWALFPLAYFRGGARPGGADETAAAVVPLFYYHRDAFTRILLTPVGFAARGPRRAGGFFGPYFWFRNEDLDAHFVPLLYADVWRRATGERTRQFGLFFAIDGPGRKSRVLVPLFGHYEDAEESDTYVFPSFFHQTRADGSKVNALIPLFWRSSGAGRATTVVGLWYDHTAPEGVHDTGFVPLWFHARNAERSLTVVPLLLTYYKHDLKTDESRLWLALLWRKHDRDGTSTTVFPLWWAASAGAKRHTVVFPLFWHFADDAAKSASTLAGPVYWSHHGTERTVGLLPVAWHSSNPADGSGATGVMPLFYEDHGPLSGTFMTLLGGWHHSSQSRFAYAGPVVPLWISHTNVPTETHTTLVVPLLLYHRSKPDSSLTSFAGVIWHNHDVTSSTTLGIPLYWDFHDYSVSRTTVAFPILFRHANEVAGTETWIAPLFYRHTTPTDSTTVAFPLYWSFTGKDTSTTVLLPLFAHWHRPDHTSTWVFPTIYHSTGFGPGGQPDGTWHWVVAPFYAAAVKRPGDFMWEILGGLVGHETVGRNRYLKLFFIRFEQEPAPRAQTAWYSQPVRTSRRERVRGLSMNTW